MNTTTTCVGCGAALPDEEGPVHAYMTSAPACWRMFGELLAAGSARQIDPGTAQLQIDAYASQHATNHDQRNRQSVAVHLMSLCATLEMRLPAAATTRLLGEWLRRPGGLPDFTSPPPHGDVTVADVWTATDRDEHTAGVAAWGRSTWASYSAVHDAVRALVQERMSGSPHLGPFSAAGSEGAEVRSPRQAE